MRGWRLGSSPIFTPHVASQGKPSLGWQGEREAEELRARSEF